LRLLLRLALRDDGLGFLCTALALLLLALGVGLSFSHRRYDYNNKESAIISIAMVEKANNKAGPDTDDTEWKNSPTFNSLATPDGSTTASRAAANGAAVSGKIA
jgi:hypothetical protein